MTRDIRIRSLIKTITWRILASLDTFLIAWFVSGSISVGGWIATIEVITKIILYYFHERAWNRVKWGQFENKFINCLSLFTTGITSIIYKKESQYEGITVNSFAPVSLKPKIIMWCLDKTSKSKKFF